MTLRLRNALMLLLFVISLSGPALIIFRLTGGETLYDLNSLNRHIPIIILSVFSTVSCLVIFLSFRNTNSPEIFFFYIFIFSMVFDVLKIFDYEMYGMTASRVVYYGKFLGALAVFSTGLFATGIEYRRMGITAVAIITLPAALVLVLPVDVTSLIPGGTFAVGSFMEITISLAALYLMGFLNFLIAGIKNENKIYLVIGAGIFLASTGRELLFYFDDYYLYAAGLTFLLFGTILANLRIHSIYLWD